MHFSSSCTAELVNGGGLGVVKTWCEISEGFYYQMKNKLIASSINSYALPQQIGLTKNFPLVLALYGLPKVYLMMQAGLIDLVL